MENPNNLRERNVAHLWADKRVLRFFRHNFCKKDYKNLRNVYLALCEIDSDFMEERNSKTKSIHNLTKTCSTYAGMDQGNVTEVLRFLKEIRLIDYGRKRAEDNSKIAGSFLIMYEYNENFFIRKNLSKEISGPIKNINRYYKELLKKISKVKNFSSKEEKGTDVPYPPSQHKPLTRRTQEKEVIQEEKEEPVSPLAGTSDFVRGRVERWNSLGPPLPHHNVNRPTKTLQKAVRRLEILERKNADPVFIDEKFNLYHSLLSSMSRPTAIPGYRVGLDEFFGFSSLTRERMKKQKVDFLNQYNSWFECLSNGGYEYFIQEELPDEDDPHLTVKLKNLYVREMLGGIEKKFNLEEERKFIIGANRLRKFYLERRGDLVVDEGIGEFAEDLFKALEWQFKGDFGIGHLCSGYTYSECLPKYMNQQAMLIGGE